MLSFQKGVVLNTIDDAWKEHLRELDDLKQSVQNAALEQKDPLVIYKLESFNLFKEMILKSNRDIITFLMKARLPEDQTAQKTRFIQEPVVRKKERLVESREDQQASSDASEPQKVKTQPFRAETKVGRNDPCPCGSGKKFKNCHGQAS